MIMKIEEQTLGEMIDTLFGIREEKAEVNEKLKEINAKYKDLETEILEFMQENDLQGAKGEKASATVNLGFYPNINDPEQFFTWAVTNNRIDMLRRQANSAPIKEMLDQENKLPPGIDAHTEPKLNLRKKR